MRYEVLCPWENRANCEIYSPPTITSALINLLNRLLRRGNGPECSKSRSLLIQISQTRHTTLKPQLGEASKDKIPNDHHISHSNYTATFLCVTNYVTFMA